MSPWRKVQVWFPQLIGCAISTASFMAGQWLSAAHAIASAPFFVTGTISTVVVLATSMAKTNNIIDDGWPKVECRRCKRLEEENRSLLEAIK